jgi:hypothetical protein
MTNEELTSLITTVKNIAQVECTKILSERNVESVLYGTITSISGSDYTVIIAGGTEEYTTLKNKSSSYLSVGDNVIVKAIDGNTGNGYIAAKLGESFDVSNVFWADADGAHISSTQSATTGKNLLINSEGMQVRDGTTPIASYTDMGAVIGKDSNSQVSITNNSITLSIPPVIEKYSFLGDIFSVRSYNVGDNVVTDVFYGDPIRDKYYTSKPIKNNVITSAYLTTGNGDTINFILDTDYTPWQCAIQITLEGITKWSQYSEATLTVVYNEATDNPYVYIGTLDDNHAGTLSFLVGYNNYAEASFAFAQGNNAYITDRAANASAMGQECSVFAQAAHAQGDHCSAMGYASHSEGSYSVTGSSSDTSLGFAAHAEGADTQAKGSYSHAEGYSTIASGAYSHAGGLWTTASSNWQTVIGKYNINDANDTYIFIVGNGTAYNSLSNALTVDASGNVKIKGTLTQNATW